MIVRAGSSSEGTSFGRAPQSMEWARWKTSIKWPFRPLYACSTTILVGWPGGYPTPLRHSAGRKMAPYPTQAAVTLDACRRVRGVVSGY